MPGVCVVCAPHTQAATRLPLTSGPGGAGRWEGSAWAASELGLKDRVSVGGWRGRGLASGSSITLLMRSDKRRWHSWTRQGSHRDCRDSGTGVGRHRRGAWGPGVQVWARQDPLRWVKHILSPSPAGVTAAPSLPAQTSSPSVPTGATVTPGTAGEHRGYSPQIHPAALLPALGSKP